MPPFSPDWQKLFERCCSGTWWDVLRLMDAGGNIDATDKDGFTPLHSACKLNKFDVAVTVLAKQQKACLIDVNKASRNGITLLHTACFHGHLHMVDVLLKLGADANALDAKQASPLHVASAHGHACIVERLASRLDVLVDPSTAFRITPLLVACYNKHEAVVRTLLDNGADIHARDHQGIDPLILAVLTSDMAILDLILDRHRDVDEVDDWGKSALHHAVLFNNIGAAERLLDHGACVNVADLSGSTPMGVAADRRSYGLVSLFMDVRKVFFEESTESYCQILRALCEPELGLPLASQYLEGVCAADEEEQGILSKVLLDQFRSRLTATGLCSVLLSCLSRAVSR